MSSLWSAACQNLDALGSTMAYPEFGIGPHQPARAAAIVSL
jgi:hypothetical protein